jgi:hypothetical protein
MENSASQKHTITYSSRELRVITYEITHETRTEGKKEIKFMVKQKHILATEKNRGCRPRLVCVTNPTKATSFLPRPLPNGALGEQHSLISSLD